MGKNSRLGIFDVNLEQESSNKSLSSKGNMYSRKGDRLEIDVALNTILKQMEVSGNRQRTIDDYKYYFDDFTDKTNITYVDEISNNDIYIWLDNMNVSQQTKYTRLKQLKAVLGRFFNNGWITIKFWTSIQIKVDQNIKEGTTEEEIKLLISLLDFTKYIELRDGVAVMLMWETGIRIRTLSSLEIRHIDFHNNTLNLDGDVLKGRRQLKIPFSKDTKRFLGILIESSNKIKSYYGQKNNLVFVTTRGTTVINSSSNAISKKLTKYGQQYGLKNINPHAIRRGFAKKLLKRGCNVALISKALGHSNIEITTKYLHLDVEEVADELKNYLD